jgi:hypothetical protein
MAKSGQEASGRVQQASEQEQQKAAQTGDQAGSTFAAAAAGHAARFKQESGTRAAQAKPPSGGTGDSAEAQGQASEKIAGQAAQKFAFTGKMASRSGYPKVRFDYQNSPKNLDGTFQKAYVWFDP